MHIYSAENHDWDMTLRAAWVLVMTGQAVKHLPTPGSVGEKEFGCYSGSMMLSFCAIESFTASIAFCMSREDRYSNFDFAKFRRTNRFAEKIDLICAAIPYTPDRSQGLFQIMGEMQEWRNLVAHASPYAIDETPIRNTTGDPHRLHRPFASKQYPVRVNLSNAQKFYGCAYDYIELIKGLTGLDPRASVTYQIGQSEE